MTIEDNKYYSPREIASMNILPHATHHQTVIKLIEGKDIEALEVKNGENSRRLLVRGSDLKAYMDRIGLK